MEKVKWNIDHLWKGDAQLCYEEVHSLEKITPQNVLDYARDENSELHKCFLWDDSEAAEKYRLEQARHIIISFRIIPQKKEDRPVRTFQISSEQRVYQPIKFFQQNKDEYQILLNRAISELKAFERRYKSIAELEEIFNLINEL